MPLHYYRALLVHGAAGKTARYLIVFPDLPGCASGGATSTEASNGALAALRHTVERLLASGEALPVSSRIGAPLPGWMQVGRPMAEMFFPVQVGGISRPVPPGPTLPGALPEQTRRVPCL